MKKLTNVWVLLALLLSAVFVSCEGDGPGDEIDPSENGIIGEWEAYDVSPILVGLGYDDSLYVKFNEDQTYEVKSYISGAEAILVGTYTQTKSTETDLWSITLNMSSLNGSPVDITSEGIFQVFDANPDSLWYEVSQTNPEISGVTAPSISAGFGSTSGGAFGEANIQKYRRK
ncbi:hypothetical protein [Algivirga pacifica]|uniref:Lipocalin-like domain-containing protein n=1 Tax=Algivirga pacifica TaxID=1162670 RepID=A0ABP9DGE9_9BACT